MGHLMMTYIILLILLLALPLILLLFPILFAALRYHDHVFAQVPPPMPQPADAQCKQSATAVA
jgi:hypothetical protein